MLGSPLWHVKWFTDPTAYPTRYDLLFTPPVLVAFAVAALAVGVAYLLEQRFPEPKTVKWLERFAPYAPTALGLHLGVALVVASLLGFLFVPSKTLEVGSDDNLFGFLILTAEAMCGLMIVFGLATRAAAVTLALLGLVAMIPFTVESILEQVHIFGIAAFLFLVGRGPLSLDRLRGVKPPLTGPEIPWTSLTLVRVAMGFAIFYGALTEKLLNPALSESLLAEHPYLNVTRLGPVSLPDGQFVYLAGVTELVIGAVVMSQWLTRPVMAVGATIFTLTLFVFGWKELLGHLPFYGIMFLLFIAPKADSPRVRRAMQARA